MLSYIRPALVTVFAFTLALGLAYPLALTGLGQILFSDAANGSLIRQGALIVGSDLIGQEFAEPGYFHPRPSATDTPYDAMASSGSNLGPLSNKLKERMASDIQKRAAGDVVPADAVMASASGLDPHISLENALSQVARVAAARGIDEQSVSDLVRATTEKPLWIIGETRVNVLQLNLAIDKLTQG